MQGYGFIREKREIKFLTLFAMSYLPISITEEALLDICLCDGAFGYLEFMEAFHELLETGHVLKTVGAGGEKQYSITAKGREASKTFENTLPVSVRDHAQKAAVRVVREIRRDAAIRTETTKNGEQSYCVDLAISDGSDDIMKISMLVVTPRQGDMLEKNFRKNAEKIYNAVLEQLLKDEDDDAQKINKE